MVTCVCDSFRRPQRPKEPPEGGGGGALFPAASRDEVSFWSFGRQTGCGFRRVRAESAVESEMRGENKSGARTHQSWRGVSENKFTFFVRPTREMLPASHHFKRKMQKRWALLFVWWNCARSWVEDAHLYSLLMRIRMYIILYTRRRRVSLALCATPACISCTANANEFAILIWKNLIYCLRATCLREFASLILFIKNYAIYNLSLWCICAHHKSF